MIEHMVVRVKISFSNPVLHEACHIYLVKSNFVGQRLTKEKFKKNQKHVLLNV